MTVDYKNPDQSKRWLKIRHEMAVQEWICLVKLGCYWEREDSQQMEGKIFPSVLIFHLLVEKLHHCKIK